MKTKITDHYDTAGIITGSSDPRAEFALWQAHAAANPSDWTGEEFTLEDFEEHIANLRYDERHSNNPGGERSQMGIA